MTKRKEYPTQARVRELFDYENGKLVWRNRSDRKKNWNAKYAGKPAGYKRLDGSNVRWRISIDGVKYLYICVIYIYFYGEIKEGWHVKSTEGSWGYENISSLYLAKGKYQKPLGNIYTVSKHGLRGIKEQCSGNYQALFFGKDLGTYKTKEIASFVYENEMVKKYGSSYIRIAPLFTDKQVELDRVLLGQGFQGIPRHGRRFAGVFKNHNNFMAKIAKPGGGYRYLGTYKTEEDAARAYNRGARDRYGEKANLNDLTDPFGDGAPI